MIPGAMHWSQRPARRAFLAAASVPVTALLAACGRSTGDKSVCTPVDSSSPPSEQDDMTDTAPSEHRRLSPRGLGQSPDGALLAAAESADRRLLGRSSSWGTILWNTSDGSIERRFGNGLTDAIAWHPGGELLALGGGGVIEITDLSGRPMTRLTGHGRRNGEPGRILDLSFTADGSRLASLGSDGTVRLWDTAAGACSPGPVLDVRRLSPTRLSFDPGSGHLVIVGPKGAPERWDVSTGRRTDRLTDIKGQPYGVTHAEDGTLVVGTAEPPRLQSVGPSAYTDAPEPPAQRPIHIAIAPDGRIAVGGEHDNQVMVWDPRSGERVDLPRVAGSVEQLTWSPDGGVLYGVSPSDGVVGWDGEQWNALELPPEQ